MKTLNISEGQGSFPFQNAYPILDYFTTTLNLDKELKMKQKLGIIYIATNLINGKQNVGQTTRSLKRRIWEHKVGMGHSLLYSAIKKYGIENFKWISFTCPEEELDWQETFLIEKLNTLASNGYNLDSGGHKNKHHQKSTNYKISKARKKYYKNNPEEKEKQSQKLKKYYEDNPQKREEAAKKTKKYFKILDNRIKASKAHKGIQSGEKNYWYGKGYLLEGKNNPFYGKKHTQKTKKIISKKLSAENHPKARPVILISPKGKEYNLLCYKPFCERHNLNNGSICHVLQGKQKHHRGWTGRYIKEKNEK